MLVREREVRQYFVLSEIHQLRQPRPASTDAVGDPPPRRSGALRIWLVEDGADGRGDHLLRTLRHQRLRITHEMRAAPLPTGALQYRRDGGLEPFVGIAGDQLHAGQPARYEAAQEGVPERTVLAGSNIEPEHFTLAVLIDADGDHHGHANDAMVLSDLHKGGVKLKVRVGAIEFARSKPLHLRVQCLAQPADLALRDDTHAKRLDQIVHPTRADTVDVRLLNHGH